MTQVLTSSVTPASSSLNAQNKKGSTRFTSPLRILLTNMLARQLESEEEFTTQGQRAKCALLQSDKDTLLFKLSSLLVKVSARVWLTTLQSCQKNLLSKSFAKSLSQTLQLKAAHNRLNSKLQSFGVSTNQCLCFLSNQKTHQERCSTKLPRMVNNQQLLRNLKKV